MAHNFRFSHVQGMAKTYQPVCVKTRADLARHVGVSRAWVTKVLGSVEATKAI